MKTPDHLYLAIGFWVALVLSAGVGFAVYELDLIERNVDRSAAASAETLALVNQSLKGTHKNGDDGLLLLAKLLLANGSGAANALKQTMQDANRIAKSEESRTAALSDSSLALVNTANRTVARLGSAAAELGGAIADVRGETLPKLNVSIDSLNSGVGSIASLANDLRPTARASTELVAEATDTIGALKETIGTANTLLADPELAEIVHNMALTSANVDGVAGNLRLVTMDVHRMLNPKKTTFWEALAMTAAKSVLGSAAGPVISHFWPLGVTIENPPGK